MTAVRQAETSHVVVALLLLEVVAVVLISVAGPSAEPSEVVRCPEGVKAVQTVRHQVAE